MTQPHRVVVTGMGAVTPLGADWGSTWRGLREGCNGIRRVKTFDPGDMPVAFGGEVDDLVAADCLARPISAKAEKSVQLGMIAAREALRQAGIVDDQEMQRDTAVAVALGSGLGPWRETEASALAYQRGWKSVRPTTVPKSMYNTLASSISLHFGLTGCHYVVASACTSASVAIAQAYMMVKSGMETAVLCGGADAPIGACMMGVWMNMRILARHDDPALASRPFDKKRNGLVFGDAAAMLVVESLESAQARGATVLAEIAGVGGSSDAFHLTAPSQAGQANALRRCLASAEVRPEDVHYINAHGTGTEANDRVEAMSILDVFGPRGRDLPISSTKSMIGHSLGTSGAVEMLVLVQSILDQYVHPTRNCDEPDPEVGLDYVPHQGREHPIDAAISNSFGFGGNNTVLLCRRFRP
jgi:3-oxoacyl-[acyl-carrier-protein] synthase II